MNGSIFPDDLAIYITTRNQRIATRALKGVNNELDEWAVESGITFFSKKPINMIFIKKQKRMEITSILL